MKKNVVSSIERLGDGGLEILNLVVAKPNIPPDIAHNYKQVKLFSLYPFFLGQFFLDPLFFLHIFAGKGAVDGTAGGHPETEDAADCEGDGEVERPRGCRSAEGGA